MQYELVVVGYILIWQFSLFGEGLPLFGGVIKRPDGSLSFGWHEADDGEQGGADWRRERRAGEEQREDEGNKLDAEAAQHCAGWEKGGGGKTGKVKLRCAHVDVFSVPVVT